MSYSETINYSALLRATLIGAKDIAELLIAAGAPLDVIYGSGYTPLHIGSMKGYKDIVELLIANGAKIDAKTEEYLTPLYLAAYHQHGDIARLLLNYGAMMEPEIAVMLGDLELVKHYIKQGVDVNSKLTKGFLKGESWLIAAVRSKNKDVVEFILNCGADVNEKIKLKNISPLHQASTMGCKNICKLLIDRGAREGLE